MLIYFFIAIHFLASRIQTRNIDYELNINMNSEDENCKTIIETYSKAMDKYEIEDLYLIPHPLFVRPIYVRATRYCEIVIRILSRVDDSRKCENSERNKKEFEQFRDKGDLKKKYFCERAFFLNTLNRCRPKAANVERDIKRQISKFKISNENSFQQICW